MPMPNMALMATFLAVAICSPHSTGNGSTTVMISITRLNTPMNKSSDFWYPQVPFVDRSHSYDSGRQIKQVASTVARKKAKLIACTV